MKILKYIILALLLWGIPSFFSYDISIGSKLNILTFGLLILFYFLNEKRKILFPFIILGLLYFIISGLHHIDDTELYTYKFIKYIIIIVCGAEVARETSKKEFFIFLILGASTILFHALFFQNGYGRYSGLYLNPNGAGFVCLIGYCLSFTISSKKLRVFGQILLTVAGILTFSRTFFFLWFMVSLLSVFVNKKNVVNFGIGLTLMTLVFSLAEFLQLNSIRLSAFETLFSNSSASAVIEDGSRLDTWSKYYEMILDKPIFGNGYLLLSGYDASIQGVHNTFLMILGEAGILPFLLIIGIYLFMLGKGSLLFKAEPTLLITSMVLIGILFTMHNYFDNNLILFASMWIFINIIDFKHTPEEEPISSNLNNIP